MSGGHFDYKDMQIRYIADEIERVIQEDDGNFPLSPEVIKRFKEAVVTLRRASIMMHRIDWLLSGDDGEETFIRNWDKELKELTP